MGSDGAVATVVDPASTAVERPSTALDLCRPATTVDERTALLDAWRAVRADPDGHAVVLRGRRPVAVLTAGRIAEAWPGGGPAAITAATVADVLPRPVGVAAAEAGTDVAAVAHRLLAGGTASMPVVSRRGDLLGVVGWPDVMRTLLTSAPTAGSS